jgi:serine/threonine protein kinase
MVWRHKMYASKRPELLTNQIDVYSYGIICYEMLIRKFSFEGHPIIVVLDGNQPKAFGYVDN